MSHSLIRRLARMYTATSIDVFSPHALTHLFEQMPEIDEIIENPFGHGQLNLRDRLEVARDIKSRRYETTYVLPNSLKSALIPFFAKIPNRVGYTGEFRFGLINRRHTLDKNKYSLLASQYLQLAKTDLSESITLSEYPALTVAQRDLGPSSTKGRHWFRCLFDSHVFRSPSVWISLSQFSIFQIFVGPAIESQGAWLCNTGTTKLKK